MKIPTSLKQAVTKNQLIIVATANQRGTPHLAVAKGLVFMGDERVAFKNWFCLQTLENIAKNPRIALSVFGPSEEKGFQIIGTVKHSQPAEIMDGYTPEEETLGGHIPQAKLQLVLKVDKILEFSAGPHSDEKDLFLDAG
jgi:predicted pyridoxine 5'-phosphate oxidase superfamily flavin-nucleotide-binding protein